MPSSKRKGKKSAAKKREAKDLDPNSGDGQLKRTQQYLGLRRASEDDLSPEALSLSRVESPQPAIDVAALVSQIDSLIDSLGRPDFVPIEPNRPAQFPQHGSVVFVAIDIEAYERNHSQITEIGVATLDTRDLLYRPPGEDGKDWISKIRGRHFRVREYSYLQNTSYLKGNPDRFEFGKSEWISLSDASAILASCFCVGAPHNETTDTSTSANPTQASSSTSPVGKARNVVLVGHTTGADIAFLKKLDFDVHSLKNLLDIFDVAEMDRHMKHLPQGRSLASIIYEFGITGWNLHNAGNDAVYTMQALLGLALRYGKDTDQSDRMETKDREEGYESEDEMYGGWGGLGRGVEGAAGDVAEGGAGQEQGAWGGDWEGWVGEPENEGNGEGGEVERSEREGSETIHKEGEEDEDADHMDMLGSKSPKDDDHVKDTENKDESSSTDSSSGGGVSLLADHRHHY